VHLLRVRRAARVLRHTASHQDLQPTTVPFEHRRQQRCRWRQQLCPGQQLPRAARAAHQLSAQRQLQSYEEEPVGGALRPLLPRLFPHPLPPLYQCLHARHRARLVKG
jgi:hypothetical protein